MSPNYKENLLKAHFLNPLKRLTESDRKEIESLVYFPLLNPKLPGGFTKTGEQWAKESNAKDLLKLSNEHKERIRIEIHAVLQTAYLFTKSKKGTLEPPEKDLLAYGIVLEEKYDRLQTVKKGGILLTDEFELKLTNLFKALKKDSPETRPFIKLLKEAAGYQAHAKKIDKDKLSNVMSL